MEERSDWVLWATAPLFLYTVEQLPTIIEVTKGIQVAFPAEDFTIKCKAKGNPAPEYHWTKNGHPYNPPTDKNVRTIKDSGSFIIHNDGNILSYNGTYRCYASNKLGTAVSEETIFLIPGDPRFPEEEITPVVLVLHCKPPTWMTQEACGSKSVYDGPEQEEYSSFVIDEPCETYKTLCSIIDAVKTLEEEHAQYKRDKFKKTKYGSQEHPIGDKSFQTYIRQQSEVSTHSI